jgi:hypothetical protein
MPGFDLISSDKHCSNYSFKTTKVFKPLQSVHENVQTTTVNENLAWKGYKTSGLSNKIILS